MQTRLDDFGVEFAKLGMMCDIIRKWKEYARLGAVYRLRAVDETYRDVCEALVKERWYVVDEDGVIVDWWYFGSVEVKRDA